MTSTLRVRSAASVALLLLVCTLPTPAQTTSVGFDATSTTLPTTGFLGGFDVLPGGDLVVFDGGDVSAIDSATLAVTTLFTPPTGAMFGAFLRVSPDGATLWFGESQFGDVWRIPLDGGAASVVVNAGFPYDLAFAPDGGAYLSWSPGFGQGNVVSRLDLATGALDDIVTSTEVSGPLAFDGDDLVYVRPDSSSFPPPADATRLMRFTAAQVASAIGPTSLVDLVDGATIAQLDGGFGLALDGRGSAYVSDSVNDLIARVDLTSGTEEIFVDGGVPFNGVTFLRFVDGPGPAAFLPWQPAGGGELLGVRTDFFSFNDIVTAAPARSRLTTSLPSPIPFGPYRLRLDGAQPGGAALLLIGLGGVLPGEFWFPGPQTGIPLFFGLRGPILPVAVHLDSNGAFDLPAFSLAIPGFTLGVQVFFGDSFAGPFRGSSQPLAID